MNRSEGEKHMQKLSNQEFGEVVVRLLGGGLGSDKFDRFESHLDQYLREHDFTDQRIIVLAMLKGAAFRLTEHVSIGEFEGHLADAVAYFTEAMRAALRFFESEREGDDYCEQSEGENGSETRPRSFEENDRVSPGQKGLGT
jgi:hypothetical protein